MNNSFKA